MNIHILKTGVGNLLKLIFVAHPLFFTLVWVEALLLGAEDSRNIIYSIEIGLFYYLGSVIYILFAGLIYNIFVLLIPGSLNRFTRRVLAVVLTSSIPLCLVLVGEAYQTITEFLVPVILALFTYGLMVRFPVKPEED